MKRVRQMLISPEVLMMLGRGSFRVVKNEVPEDAKLVGAGYDGTDFYLILESRDFLLVDDGEATPTHTPPQIERLDSGGGKE